MKETKRSKDQINSALTSYHQSIGSKLAGSSSSGLNGLGEPVTVIVVGSVIAIATIAASIYGTVKVVYDADNRDKEIALAAANSQRAYDLVLKGFSQAAVSIYGGGAVNVPKPVTAAGIFDRIKESLGTVGTAAVFIGAAYVAWKYVLPAFRSSSPSPSSPAGSGTSGWGVVIDAPRVVTATDYVDADTKGKPIRVEILGPDEDHDGPGEQYHARHDGIDGKVWTADGKRFWFGRNT
jgi:hypothetical protein